MGRAAARRIRVSFMVSCVGSGSRRRESRVESEDGVLVGRVLDVTSHIDPISESVTEASPKSLSHPTSDTSESRKPTRRTSPPPTSPTTTATMHPTLRALGRRIQLTTKDTNKGYYKGNRTGSMGSHTKYGTYKIDYKKVRTFVVPDLEGFSVSDPSGFIWLWPGLCLVFQ